MAARKEKRRRSPPGRFDVQVPGGGFLVLGGALIAAAAGAAWSLHRARAKNRLRRDTGDQSGTQGEEERKGMSSCEQSCMEGGLVVEIQENGFIHDIKEKSEIGAATEENHPKANVSNDDVKDILLDSNESNTLDYPNKEMAEELRSNSFKEVEKKGGKEIEVEAPSIDSEGEESEYTVVKEGEKEKLAIDETGVSCVESNTDTVWPAETIEKEEGLLHAIETMEMKNNLTIQECTKDVVEMVQAEEEIVEEYELKGEGQEKGATVTDGSMNKTIPAATMTMEKRTDYASVNHSKRFLLMLENGFIHENEEKSEIGMAKEDSHPEANIRHDDGKNISVNSDEYNMPDYPNEKREEELHSIGFKKLEEAKDEGKDIEEAPSVKSQEEDTESAVDEEGAKGEVGSDETIPSSVEFNAEAIWPVEMIEKDIEEAPSVKSREEDTESAVDEEGAKGEVGSDETIPSSVEFNAEAIWPVEMIEKHEGLLPLEHIEMKNKLKIQEHNKDVVDAEQSEDEIVEGYEHKDVRQEKEEVAAVANGNMNINSSRSATTMTTEKENGFIHENREKSNIDTETKESHAKGNSNNDHVKDLASSDIDESNMLNCPNKEMAEGLKTTNLKVEELEGSSETEEETPSIKSEAEEIEFSAEEEKTEVGSDESTASSVESTLGAVWPAEMIEKDEGLLSELITMKIDLPDQQRANDVINVAQEEEEEEVEEYEHKDAGLEAAAAAAIANGNENSSKLTTRTMVEKKTNFASLNNSKNFLISLILALAIGLVSFAHHRHVVELYHQFFEIFLSA